jgi:hypothetical protein
MKNNKVRFLAHDFRAQNGKAKCVAMLRRTLAQIERGSIEAENMVIVIKEREVGNDNPMYAYVSSGETNETCMWLHMQGILRALGR